MSVPYHGSPEQKSELVRVQDALREEQRLREKFADQMSGKATREYPAGRLGADDEGELAYMVAGDPEHGVVRVEFGKSVDWLGLPPQDAIDLAQSLIKHARAIAKEPLSIALH